VQFSSQRLADVFVAAPVGQIDHTHAQELQQALVPLLAAAAPDHNALVLDFTGVEYISSTGLRVLLMAAKQAKAQNSRIAVAALQPVVKEIFDIARFNHVLEAFVTVRAALEKVSAPALATYDAAAK
jgi:anti-anti-sigma factor